MRIIDILNIIAKGEIPPREIRYNMLQDGYKDLIYNQQILKEIEKYIATIHKDNEYSAK